MQRAGPTLHTAFLFFGCSLKIRKKQGESGHLQTAGLIWVRDCIKRGCGLVGRNPTKRKEKPVAAQSVLKTRCSPL